MEGDLKFQMNTEDDSNGRRPRMEDHKTEFDKNEMTKIKNNAKAKKVYGNNISKTNEEKKNMVERK